MTKNYNKYNVRVIKGSMPYIWYLANIGESFMVRELDQDFWIIPNTNKVFLKTDCEIIK